MSNKRSDAKRQRVASTRSIDPPPNNVTTDECGKSTGSKLLRCKPTSLPLTRPDAVEIWKRWRLGEAIHDIAAGFCVNPSRIDKVLNGQCFPEAEELSLI